MKINNDLEAQSNGRQTVKYRLRDWLVSRQRYWGTPIPIIHCSGCGAVPVPEHELPIRLPYDVKFRPSGDSPLVTCSEFVNTSCPVCGKPAKRDTDTLDTFVCSSWYFLRFYDNKNIDSPFNKTRTERIMPVNKYIGGIEHATLHLLYARFITKALRDMGLLSFSEPFPSLFHQGIILGKDGRKMSKRDGAVSPDILIERYGSDVFRMCLAFSFSYVDGGVWDDNGIKAIARFVSRIGRLIDNFMSYRNTKLSAEYKLNEKLEYVRNITIKHVCNDLEAFNFNTAVARIMEYLNALFDYQNSMQRNALYEEELIKDFILLTAPLAPHMSEELWEYIGCPYSVHNQRFPKYDETKLVFGTIDIAVQINGRLRDVITVHRDATEDEIKQSALSSEKIQAFVNEQQVKKYIFIKGRLINIIS